MIDIFYLCTGVGITTPKFGIFCCQDVDFTKMLLNNPDPFVFRKISDEGTKLIETLTIMHGNNQYQCYIMKTSQPLTIKMPDGIPNGTKINFHHRGIRVPIDGEDDNIYSIDTSKLIDELTVVDGYVAIPSDRCFIARYGEY